MLQHVVNCVEMGPELADYPGNGAQHPEKQLREP